MGIELQLGTYMTKRPIPCYFGQEYSQLTYLGLGSCPPSRFPLVLFSSYLSLLSLV